MFKLCLGVFIIGFAPILVKAVTIGPTLSVVYRLGLGAVIFLPYSLHRLMKIQKTNPQSLQVSRSFFWLLMLTGTLLAVDFYTWHHAVVYLGAGLSTLLSNTQAFYLSAFGILFLGERGGRKFFLALLLAMIGIFLALKVEPAQLQDPKYLPGVGYGLVTGLFWAGYIIAFKKLERVHPEIGVIIKFVVVLFIATIIAAIFTYAEGQAQTPTVRDFWLLVVLAVGPQVIGWTLIAQSLPHVPLTKAALILLLQPIVALSLGAVVFNETLSTIQLLGVALSLGGIYLGSVRTAADAR